MIRKKVVLNYCEERAIHCGIRGVKPLAHAIITKETNQQQLINDFLGITACPVMPCHFRSHILYCVRHMHRNAVKEN